MQRPMHLCWQKRRSWMATCTLSPRSTADTMHNCKPASDNKDSSIAGLQRWINAVSVKLEVKKKEDQESWRRERDLRETLQQQASQIFQLKREAVCIVRLQRWINTLSLKLEGKKKDEQESRKRERKLRETVRQQGSQIFHLKQEASSLRQQLHGAMDQKERTEQALREAHRARQAAEEKEASANSRRQLALEEAAKAEDEALEKLRDLEAQMKDCLSEEKVRASTVVAKLEKDRDLLAQKLTQLEENVARASTKAGTGAPGPEHQLRNSDDVNRGGAGSPSLSTASPSTDELPLMTFSSFLSGQLLDAPEHRMTEDSSSSQSSQCLEFDQQSEASSHFEDYGSDVEFAEEVLCPLCSSPLASEPSSCGVCAKCNCIGTHFACRQTECQQPFCVQCSEVAKSPQELLVERVHHDGLTPPADAEVLLSDHDSSLTRSGMKICMARILGGDGNEPVPEDKMLEALCSSCTFFVAVKAQGGLSMKPLSTTGFQICLTGCLSGHGRLLFQAARQFALRSGAKFLALYPSEKARGFWHHLGFRTVVEARRVHHANDPVKRELRRRELLNRVRHEEAAAALLELGTAHTAPMLLMLPS